MSQSEINTVIQKGSASSISNKDEATTNERAITIGSNFEGSSSRQRRVILTEEEYTSTLDNIISRDYFPALPSLKRDIAILQKRAENDIPGAVSIRRAARALQQHKERLKQIDQQQEQEARETGFRSNPRPLHRESVDGFHARVTSEDNEEFSRATKQEERQKGELVLATVVKENNKLMLLKTGEAQTTNPFFFPPKLLPSSNQPETNQGKTDTLLLKDKNDIDSLIMPPPDNRNKPNQIIVAPESFTNPPQTSLVEYVAKASADSQIKIQPSQTRFPHQSESRLITASSSGNQNYLSQITINDGDETTDLDDEDNNLHSLSSQKDQRLKKEREAFVCMTPQIVPNENNGSPITTWGEIASTPLVLSQGDELLEARKFDLPPLDTKDSKAREVEAKLLKRSKMYKMANSKTKTKNKTFTSKSLQPPSNKSSSIRKSSNQYSVNARSSSAFGSALRASYSSSVTSHRSNSSRKRKRSMVHQPTPKLLPASQRKVLDSTSNVTDGLLNLT